MKQHSNHFLDLVTDAKQQITEITAENLQHKLADTKPFYLIDVREDEELLSGHIPTAIHMSKGIIERDIEKCIPDTQADIVVYCSGGYRSALVALNLKTMGYQHVASLNGGLRGWLEIGCALTSQEK